MKQYKVVFEYADAMSHWNWREQMCYVYADSEYGARRKCVELYGLGMDCEYRIKNIEQI